MASQGLAMPVRRNLTFLQQWLPDVRFEIPFTHNTSGYYNFISDILKKFVVDADSRNARNWRKLISKPNIIGNISNVHIDGLFISRCELFWDDGSPGCNFWNGLRFYDEIEKGHNCVRMVYVLADAFEKFLRAQNIPFSRYGRRRQGSEELQSQNI